MYALIFLGAGTCTTILATLEPNSRVGDVIITAWLLAPYLVLTAVMVITQKTSLLATAITVLLGSVGALTPLLLMTLVDSHFDVTIAARLVPLIQAGAITLLVPACRWVVGTLT